MWAKRIRGGELKISGAFLSRRTEDYGDAITIVEFEYEYDPNTNNIAEITYVHRTDDPELNYELVLCKSLIYQL
jgi:hypothetical protein